MPVSVEVVDAVGVEQTGAALDAMDDVALVEQEFGQVGAVLAGDAGNEGNFGSFLHSLFLQGYVAWFFRKSSYAFFRPASKPIWTCQPRAFRRVLSMSLRGVPPGLLGSKAISPA